MVPPESLLEKKLTFTVQRVLGFLWKKSAVLSLEGQVVATLNVASARFSIPVVHVGNDVYTFELRKLFWPIVVRVHVNQAKESVATATLQLPEKDPPEWLLTPAPDHDYLFEFVSKDLTEAALVTALDHQHVIKFCWIGRVGEITIHTVPPEQLLPLLLTGWVFSLGYGLRSAWNY